MFPSLPKETFFYKEAVMANNQQQYLITAGPSREDLFDALRLRHEGRTTTFTVTCLKLVPSTYEGRAVTREFERPCVISVHVDAIGVEDGSGDSWLITVYDKSRSLGSAHLTGYYHTTKRSGNIRLVSDRD